MPISYRKGDVIADSGMVAGGAIVVTVNCVGVMGKGVALAAKGAFPWCLVPYQDACDRQMLIPGQVMPIAPPRDPEHHADPLLLLMATKHHWRNPSQLVWVERGLSRIGWMLGSQRWQQGRDPITSLALPWPGCGLGGLSRGDVQPLIEKYLGELAIPVTVWE